MLLPDMPFDQYLAHPALSASGMKHLLDSPARYRWEREHPYDSPTLRLGRLIHALAFEQDHPFTVKDWDGRTTAGKTRAAEVTEQGLEIVSGDDWECAEGIAKALRANRLASGILFDKDVQHEVSAVWTDKETGVELRCRFDALHDIGDIGDLKSAPRAKPTAFIRDAATYGYLMTAAHYRAASIALGLNRDPRYLLVAVEKSRPHFISVVGINEYDLQLGERLRRKAIRIYADCMERDHWPAYDEEIHYPDAPGWWRSMAEEQTGLYEIEVPA